MSEPRATEPTPPQSTIRFRRLRRAAKWMFAASLMIAGAGALGEAIAGAAASRRHPPPGRLIDIGSHRLHLDCRGDGEPTVILESGLGRDGLDWSWVLPELSQTTRTCAYDRAGLGWSDVGPQPRDSQQIATELDALLDAAGLDGPFVLVGHSAGGSHAQVFEHRFPESVAGMVLIDVSHRPEPIQNAPPAALVTIAKGLRVLGVLRTFGLIDGDDLHPEVQAAANAVVYRPSFISTVVAENEAVAVNAESIRRIGGPGSLGGLPLVVITAAGPVDDQPRPPGMSLDEARRDQALRHRLQRELLAMSADSRQVWASASGHQVHKDQPELVVEAVRGVVEDWRADRPDR